jgi:hypothetical protein
VHNERHAIEGIRERPPQGKGSGPTAYASKPLHFRECEDSRQRVLNYIRQKERNTPARIQRQEYTGKNDRKKYTGKKDRQKYRKKERHAPVRKIERNIPVRKIERNAVRKKKDMHR